MPQFPYTPYSVANTLPGSHYDPFDFSSGGLWGQYDPYKNWTYQNEAQGMQPYNPYNVNSVQNYLQGHSDLPGLFYKTVNPQGIWSRQWFPQRQWLGGGHSPEIPTPPFDPRKPQPPPALPFAGGEDVPYQPPSPPPPPPPPTKYPLPPVYNQPDPRDWTSNKPGYWGKWGTRPAGGEDVGGGYVTPPMPPPPSPGGFVNPFIGKGSAAIGTPYEGLPGGFPPPNPPQPPVPPPQGWPDVPGGSYRSPRAPSYYDTISRYRRGAF